MIFNGFEQNFKLKYKLNINMYVFVLDKYM